jgi:putative flippase GtrA
MHEGGRMTKGRGTLRYAAVSGVCMLAHNSVMIAADHLGHAILAGALASFCIVVSAGYLLHSRYTFAASRSRRGFLRYAAAMAVNVPLSAALTWGFTQPTGWPMAARAPAATFASLALNYAASAWAMSPRLVQAASGGKA